MSGNIYECHNWGELLAPVGGGAGELSPLEAHMAACLLGTGGAGRGALGDEGGWESTDSQPLLPPPPHLPALTLVSTATAINISPQLPKSSPAPRRRALCWARGCGQGTGDHRTALSAPCAVGESREKIPAPLLASSPPHAPNETGMMGHHTHPGARLLICTVRLDHDWHCLYGENRLQSSWVGAGLSPGPLGGRPSRQLALIIPCS